MAMLYTPHTGVVTMHNGATATGRGTSIQTLSTDGASSYVTIQIEGISGDTITFEGTIDNETWYALRFVPLSTGTVATTATADGLYQSDRPVLGLYNVSARISTYSAGVIIIKGVAVG